MYVSIEYMVPTSLFNNIYICECSAEYGSERQFRRY